MSTSRSESQVLRLRKAAMSLAWLVSLLVRRAKELRGTIHPRWVVAGAAFLVY